MFSEFADSSNEEKTCLYLGTDSVEGVLVAPGATALTRIPSLAHSHPQLIVNLFIAALLAAYVAPENSIDRLIEKKKPTDKWHINVIYKKALLGVPICVILCGYERVSPLAKPINTNNTTA